MFFFDILNFFMNILILSYFLFQLCFYFVASMNYDMYKSLIKGFKNLKFKNMFYYVYSFIILILIISLLLTNFTSTQI